MKIDPNKPVSLRLRDLADHLAGLDSGSGEAALMREAAGLLDLHDGLMREASELIEELRSKSSFSCAAKPWEKRDPPSDCAWPGCGCDPHADKVIEALDEQGFLKRAGYEG